MNKTLVNKMIQAALDQLGINLELVPDELFGGLFRIEGVGWLKAEVEFFEEANLIGVSLFLRIVDSMDEPKKSELRERLSQISDLPEFFENGVRWMRMKLSAEPLHIAIAAKIKPDGNEFSEAYLLSKLKTMFTIMVNNWPTSSL